VGLDEIDDCCLETQLGHRARKHDPVEQFMLSCVLELFACEIVPTGAATVCHNVSTRNLQLPAPPADSKGRAGTRRWSADGCCRPQRPYASVCFKDLNRPLAAIINLPIWRPPRRPPAVKAATTSPWQPPSLRPGAHKRGYGVSIPGSRIVMPTPPPG